VISLSAGVFETHSHFPFTSFQVSTVTSTLKLIVENILLTTGIIVPPPILGFPVLGPTIGVSFPRAHGRWVIS
jgi:hypothetical protein